MNVDQLLSLLGGRFSGARARDIAAEIAGFHRVQGSPGYDAAVSSVRERLAAVGVASRVHEYPADGRAKTYEWRCPPAWHVRGGRLRERSPNERTVVTFDDVPVSICPHSPGGTVEGELVHVGKGTDRPDYAGIDVSGRFVLAHGRVASVVAAARERGAIGVVIYPDNERAATSHDLVQYQGIFPSADEIPGLIPAFSVSRRTADGWISASATGPVRLVGEIDAAFIENALRVLEAWVPGTEDGAGEVLLVAHLCHPRESANDNASGSAVLVELAGILQAIRDEIPLRDTVRLLWVPEFYGTLPWAASHVEALRDTHFVLNLDMVGQSPEVVGEPLRVFAVPNSVPSYLNAMIEPIASRVASASTAVPRGSGRPLHWVLDQPSGGSDHLVFGAPPHRLPAIMFGHEDPHWHTNLDTIDKVDPTRLQQVGMIVGCLAALPWAAEAEHLRLLDWTLSYSVRRLVEAGSLARDLEPPARRRLLEIALEIETRRAQSLTRRIPDALLLTLLEGHVDALRTVADHLTRRLPGGAASRAPAATGRRPMRRIDGPLVYAFTDALNEEERGFFKERLAANHRAMIEGLLNLCDGERTTSDIALHLALDAGRLVSIEDVERGVDLLAKAGYVTASAE